MSLPILFLMVAAYLLINVCAWIPLWSELGPWWQRAPVFSTLEVNQPAQVQMQSLLSKNLIV